MSDFRTSPVTGHGVIMCPPPPRQELRMDTSLDVGFGAVEVEHRVSQAQRWRPAFYYVRRYDEKGPSPTMRKIENRARREGGFWRVRFDTPMCADTFERVADSRWVHVRRGMGFA